MVPRACSETSTAASQPCNEVTPMRLALGTDDVPDEFRVAHRL